MLRNSSMSMTDLAFYDSLCSPNSKLNYRPRYNHSNNRTHTKLSPKNHTYHNHGSIKYHSDFLHLPVILLSKRKCHGLIRTAPKVCCRIQPCSHRKQHNSDEHDQHIEPHVFAVDMHLRKHINTQTVNDLVKYRSYMYLRSVIYEHKKYHYHRHDERCCSDTHMKRTGYSLP